MMKKNLIQISVLLIVAFVLCDAGCPYSQNRNKRQATDRRGHRRPGGFPDGSGSNGGFPDGPGSNGGFPDGPGSNGGFSGGSSSGGDSHHRPPPPDGGKGDKRPRPDEHHKPEPVQSSQCDSNSRYSSADGSCNNLNNPSRGRSVTNFKRFLRSEYQDGVNAARTLSVTGAALPNPRYISRSLMSDNSQFEEYYTDLLVYFGQWVAHDFAEILDTRDQYNDQVIDCPCGSKSSNCLSYVVPSFDNQVSQSCFKFTRSTATTVNNKREQTNHLSSFIDGSQVYGRSKKVQDELRSFKGGRMLTSVENYLPRSHDDFSCSANSDKQCFVGGEDRPSENLALTSIHTLWLRSHNNLADGLRNRHGDWSDEKLYQEARKINLALMQHVIYSEWLPLIVGNDDDLKPKSSGYYTGYDSRVDPSLYNEFGVAAFRFGHTLIRNQLDRYTLDHKNINSNVDLSSIIFDVTEATNTAFGLGGLEKIFMGLLEQPTSKFDASFVDTLQNHLFEFVDSNGDVIALDLAATNINRGRDHGVPAYYKYRQYCASKSINSWNDLSDIMTSDNINKLKNIYNNQFKDIDLFVGGLHETRINGGIVGPTFACIIKEQFRDLKKGDRFYYENGPSRSAFSLTQLNEIRKVTMSGLICETYRLSTVQKHAFLMPYINPHQSCSSIAKLDINKF